MVETKHLIHRYVHSEKVIVPATIAADDLAYWQAQGFAAAEIPEKIVIATASTRKLVMAYALLNNFDFPHLADGQDISSTQPLELQAFFQKNIHNGDGSYKGDEILLGVYHGLPVFGRSTDGETSGNNASEESVNKVAFARDHYYQGQKVVVIAGDAVDVSLQKGEQLDHQEPLGKPGNLPDYPGDTAARHEINDGSSED